MGVKAGEYVCVTGIDRDKNLLTVQRADRSQLAYNPVRLQGVSVFKEAQRDLSQGDRIQFTTPYREHRIANREFGTVDQIHGQGNLQIRLDSGRQVRFNIREHAHLDYGYAVTSHSSQGVTADRVLVHVDTCQAHEKLLNTRLAYVAVSRGRYDAQIFTNDAAGLSKALSKEASKTSAIEVESSSTQSRDQENLLEDLVPERISRSIRLGQTCEITVER